MAQESGVTPERIYRARAVIRFGLPLMTMAAIISSAWLAGRDSAPGTEPWLTAGFIACGVAAIALGLMSARAMGRRLEVYEDWFRYRRVAKVVAARWHQVEAFYTATSSLDPSTRRRIAGRYEFGIVVGGQRLDLGTAIGADAALGMVIDARTRPRVVARTAARLRAGRAVTFGLVSLAPDRLTFRSVGARSIPLSKLESHKLEHSRYIFRAVDRKRPVVIPVGRIPDPFALHQAIEQRTDWQAQEKPTSAQRPRRDRTQDVFAGLEITWASPHR
jgi:hypothetical protein